MRSGDRNELCLRVKAWGWAGESAQNAVTAGHRWHEAACGARGAAEGSRESPKTW